MKLKFNALSILFSLSLSTILAIYLFTGSTNESHDNEKFEDTFKDHYKIYALNIPEHIDFAGEQVPLRLIDVKEKFDRELLVNTYWQSQTMLFIKRSHRWFPVIEPILKEQGVPDDFKYLALIESGLTDVVSPAGATGFWQLMKDAAKENGLIIDGGVDERYHVEKATIAACSYLKSARERFGSWTLAAASYNMGKAGLDKQLERQKATNYYDLVLNDETSRYIFRILAAKLILSNPHDFGFQFREQDLYAKLKYEEVDVDTSINSLVDFAFANGVNYKALKYLNPWLRDNYLSNASGRRFTIKIPNGPLTDQLVNDKEQVATFTRPKSDEQQIDTTGGDD
ncbi:MAG: lytic transglycosylase domain-containing protein [Flavobacteriales bacterium]